MRNLSSCLLILLGTLLLFSYSWAEPTSPAKPVGDGGSLTTLSSEKHLISVGDKIEFHIPALPDLPDVYDIRVDGHFFHPVIGDVQAYGRTLEDLRKELTVRLGKELRRPVFRLGLREVAKHQVAVLGEAKTQGSYEVSLGSTVLDVLAKAGGLSEKADQESAMILRGNEKIPLSLKPELGGGLTKVQSGDVIYILPGSTVSVSGEVTEPGVYSVSRVTGTPWEAIIRAGGAKQTASLQRARLIRASLPAPLSIDLRPDAEAGLPLEARQLQAGDIISIPPRQAIVLGTVGEPGPVSLEGGETLIDVLAKRVTSGSDIEKIYVVRAKNVKENRDEKEIYSIKEYFEKGKADSAVPIYDGDLVYVPEKKEKGKGIFGDFNIFTILSIAQFLL